MNETFQPGAIQPNQTQPNQTQATQDERTMALLAQVLQIVGWWIAPLVIFLIKRQSKFVSFHALQALLLQVLQMFVMGVGMAARRLLPDDGQCSSDQKRPTTARALHSDASDVAGLDGPLDHNAADCDHIRHQSRTRRMGRVPGTGATGSEDP